MPRSKETKKLGTNLIRVSNKGKSHYVDMGPIPKRTEGLGDTYYNERSFEVTDPVHRNMKNRNVA